MRISRYGFSELSEEALSKLGRAIKEAIEGKGRSLEEILKDFLKGN